MDIYLRTEYYLWLTDFNCEMDINTDVEFDFQSHLRSPNIFSLLENSILLNKIQKGKRVEFHGLNEFKRRSCYDSTKFNFPLEKKCTYDTSVSQA